MNQLTLSGKVKMKNVNKKLIIGRCKKIGKFVIILYSILIAFLEIRVYNQRI